MLGNWGRPLFYGLFLPTPIQRGPKMSAKETIFDCFVLFLTFLWFYLVFLNDKLLNHEKLHPIFKRKHSCAINGHDHGSQRFRK